MIGVADFSATFCINAQVTEGYIDFFIIGGHRYVIKQEKC